MCTTLMRLLSRFVLTTNKIQQPITFILSSILRKRVISNICNPYEKSLLVNKIESLNFNKRYKRTKKNDEDSDNDDNLDVELDDSSQLITFKTSTMRMDAVLKYALGKSRNKIEVAFYESRIRVNGEKVIKKSHTLEVGDEVDLVKGPSPNNSDFLLVSRVEVLSTKLVDDELLVKLRKFKNLLINNYNNKWN